MMLMHVDIMLTHFNKYFVVTLLVALHSWIRFFGLAKLQAADTRSKKVTSLWAYLAPGDVLPFFVWQKICHP